MFPLSHFVSASIVSSISGALDASDRVWDRLASDVPALVALVMLVIIGLRHHLKVSETYSAAVSDVVKSFREHTESRDKKIEEIVNRNTKEIERSRNQSERTAISLGRVESALNRNSDELRKTRNDQKEIEHGS